MGYEMYIVRDDNRTLYELGKTRAGLHVPLQEFQDRRTGTFVLTDREVLMEFLLDGILEHGSWEQPFDYRPLARELAHRMIHWGGGQPVRVVGEDEVTQLHIRDEDRYLVTDSRYSSEFPYYNAFMALERVLQEQIDNTRSAPCDLPAVRHVRSYSISRFNRPPKILIPTEEGFLEQPKEVWQRKFLDEMKALKPLTTNRGCGMFGCSVSGLHDHGLRDTNTKPELRFCGCDCHDNPVVCTGFHFCCHEVNASRKTQTPRPPVKPIKVPEFKTFTMPIIRKPFPKLMSEDLLGADPGCKELFRDVARHMIEASAALQVKEPPRSYVGPPGKFLTREEMEKLTTKRLLAYRNSLYRYPEGPSHEETIYGGIDYQMHKCRPEWKAAIALVKEILATRENV